MERMTWQVMYGSGQIAGGVKMTHTVCFVAVLGVMIPTTSGHGFRATLIRALRSTISGFDVRGPCEIIPNQMNKGYYVYVLQSIKDGKNYTGYTKDLELRFEQHKRGEVQSTKYRLPLKIIYYEWCEVIEDAKHREKYLKTHYGKMYLKNRLKSYFIGKTQ